MKRMVWSPQYLRPGSVYTILDGGDIMDGRREPFIVEACVEAPRTTGFVGALVFDAGDEPRWDGGWHVHLRDPDDRERAVIEVMES